MQTQQLERTTRRRRSLAAHWNAHAVDFRSLLRANRDPEIRQILDHLVRVCEEMASATGDTVRASERSWLHPHEVVREATAHRWRIRETMYRTIAVNCERESGRRAWTTIADRCAEIVYYLDHT